MTVAELIAKLQQHDPAAVVVLWRNVDYEAVAEQARELTPVRLRAFAAEGCGWYRLWDDAEVPTDYRTTVFAEPVQGLLLE
jgi:hypothetical protein